MGNEKMKLVRKQKSDKHREKEQNKISKFFTKSTVKRIILGIASTIVLFLVVIGNIEPKKLKVKIGDVAPYDIRSTKDIVDEDATERLKEEASDRIEPIYRVNPSVQMKIKGEVKNFFNMVRDIKTYENISLFTRVEELRKQSNIDLSEEQYSIAMRMDVKDLNNLESNIYDILNQIMSAGIKDEELEYEKENVENIFESIDMTENEKELGIGIVNSTIHPNKFVDVETTQKKKKEEADKVQPIIVKEYQIIVRKGDKIDEKAYNLIKESGLLKEKDGFNFTTSIGTLIILIMMETIIAFYLYYFDKDIYNSSKLLVLAIIYISIVAISEGVYSISPYIMPVATAAMLITLLFNAKLALVINFTLALLIGIVMGVDESVILMMIIGGSIGAFSVTNADQRYNIFFNGLIVGIVNVLIILAFGLIKKTEMLDTLIRSAYGMLNGVFSAVLTIGTLPLWENVFQVLTPLKLLELSNPNQPLLKKLLLEAPGTYHHSVVVGNLSEAAAEAIDANPLISRVGAYYHDVGKLKRPYFFKENQIGIDNPHDKLNPTLSTLIITNHTKDGAELADEYKLPKEIKDIIVQHHGDTIVAYFYYIAKKNDTTESVNVEDFRYKGPKPQTREAALIMLADSVEAAVRSIKNPNKGKIEEMVRNIIKGKLEDDQLEECDLTLRDLSTIANTFCNILFGIYHDRIEYPKLDIKQIKGEI